MTVALSSRNRLPLVAWALVASMAATAIGIAKADVPKQLAIGQQAPSFSLPNVATGDTVTLGGLTAGKKATVVLFIATRCPVSNAYNERYVSLAAAYAAKGIAFVGINSNASEPTAECASHAKDHKFSFAVVKDAGNAVADQYGAFKTPEVYVVDAKGILVYHGRIDDSMYPAEVKTHDLADALDNIVAGQPVAKTESRAFGCSIKRGRT